MRLPNRTIVLVADGVTAVDLRDRRGTTSRVGVRDNVAVSRLTDARVTALRR